ncbi:MAG: hypothetical protein KF817_03095 [Phycisphaeraceae bacterium]|nr:hypothetical protein [Phycisphaeraceae bacterium]
MTDPTPGAALLPGPLLAIDLGLRSGFAVYSSDGRLRRYGSKHYGSRTTLRRGAQAMVRILAPSHAVLEGGGEIAQVWLGVLTRAGVDATVISAHEWRADLLPRSEGEPDPKKPALAEAVRIVGADGARGPRTFRHDAAEAILIGLWWVRKHGWRSVKAEDTR